MNDPIPYGPDVEIVRDDEDETVADLKDSFETILQRVADDAGHAYRSVHAKSHALIEASLTIPDDLPEAYRQGIFARPGRHDAILRISTNPGDILDDAVSVPRGCALKVLNVKGERLDASRNEVSQDFVMINGPVFTAPDAATFAKSLKLLAATTDRAQWAKKALSSVMRGLDSLVGPNPAIESMGGAPNSHPLGETYYSQTPYRYGDYVAKVALFPVSDTLTRHAGKVVNAAGRPDALREDVDRALTGMDGPATWELRVQLMRDADAQPVEDATVEWPEEVSPFVTVARIEAVPQRGWTAPRASEVDDRMRFSPWNGVAAHRPLGSVNRARKPTYEQSADFRSRFNGCPIHDPEAARLPT